jgi:hypothetical protein
MLPQARGVHATTATLGINRKVYWKVDFRASLDSPSMKVPYYQVQTHHGEHLDCLVFAQGQGAVAKVCISIGRGRGLRHSTTEELNRLRMEC